MSLFSQLLLLDFVLLMTRLSRFTYLNIIPKHCLTKVLRKLETKEFVEIYQSCRFLKEFIDNILHSGLLGATLNVKNTISIHEMIEFSEEGSFEYRKIPQKFHEFCARIGPFRLELIHVNQPSLQPISHEFRPTREVLSRLRPEILRAVGVHDLWNGIDIITAKEVYLIDLTIEDAIKTFEICANCENIFIRLVAEIEAVLPSIFNYFKTKSRPFKRLKIVCQKVEKKTFQSIDNLLGAKIENIQRRVWDGELGLNSLELHRNPNAGGEYFTKKLSFPSEEGTSILLITFNRRHDADEERGRFWLDSKFCKNQKEIDAFSQSILETDKFSHF